MPQESIKDARDYLEELELNGSLTDEKRVLAFCCACCRLIWDKLPKIAQVALEVSERYIENKATVQDLIDARVDLWNYLGKDSLSFEKQNVVAVRAVICCLGKIKNEDEAFNNMLYAMDFCNCVEDRYSEQHHLLSEVFKD